MKTFALATIAAALFASTPALAQQPADGRAVVIPTAGLDLTTASGRATLDARIRAAASATCDASPADLCGRNRARRCRADLIAAARAQRDSRYAMHGRGAMLAVR